MKMITGDSIWTAVEVARQVGIVSKGKSTFPASYHLDQVSSVVSNATSTNDPVEDFKFVPMTVDSGNSALSFSRSNLENLKHMVDTQQATLCISGDALQNLVLSIIREEGLSPVLKKEDKHALFHPSAQAVLKDVVPLVSVFARHAPRQKEAIIAALNLGGFKTLMCGDGTNDMGKSII